MVHFKGSQCRSVNASVDKAASKRIGGVRKSSRTTSAVYVLWAF